MDARFRPLSYAEWLHPVTLDGDRRSRWTFKASWADTLDKLRYELDRLDATDIIIGCGLCEQDIRMDGWPRSGAKQPEHPGVEVSFTVPGDDQRQVYATDRHEFWEHNVRAIALTLEALRAVDRYGASEGKQYAGFRQLPAAGETSREVGEQLIQRFGGVKRALRATHPDTRGLVVGGEDMTDAHHQAVKHAAGIA